MDPHRNRRRVIQNPNFIGEVQDINYLVDLIRKKFPQAVIIYLVIEASSLGILKRPGSFGIDIVCGELQALGLPISFGGPTIGFIATLSKHMRKLPGRIVGKTKELHGSQEGYILTLQAREQHIRREKAASNICSNEALCMLSVQIYLSSMGYSGIRQNAELNIRNATYLKRKIHELTSYSVVNFESPIYNEFLVSCKRGLYPKIEKLCIMNNICPPLKLTNKMIELLSIGSSIHFSEDFDYFLVAIRKNSKSVYLIL
jgi:glycine dehydrogenase subunit 1